MEDLLNINCNRKWADFPLNRNRRDFKSLWTKTVILTHKFLSYSYRCTICKIQSGGIFGMSRWNALYVHQICKQHFGSAEYLVYRIFFCNTEHRLISCQQGKNIKSHFSIRNSLEIAFVNEEIGLVILKGLNKMVGQRRGS